MALVIVFVSFLAGLAVGQTPGNERTESAITGGEIARGAVARILAESDFSDSVKRISSAGGLCVVYPYATVDVLLGRDLGFRRHEVELLLETFLRNGSVRTRDGWSRSVDLLLSSVDTLESWSLISEVLTAADEVHSPQLDGVLRGVASRLAVAVASPDERQPVYGRAVLAVAELAPSYPSVALASILVEIARYSRIRIVVEQCRQSAEAILSQLEPDTPQID
jgi:hypothetical protein